MKCCKLGIVFALRVLKRPRNSQLSGAEGVLSGIVATSGERAHTKTARVSLDRGTVMSMWKDGIDISIVLHNDDHRRTLPRGTKTSRQVRNLNPTQAEYSANLNPSTLPP